MFSLAIAISAIGQTFYTDRALGVNPLGNTPVFLSYAQVRVCSLPLTTTAPCAPVASITDQFGNLLGISGGNFGQLKTDVVGRFTFGCAPGNYQVQVAPTGSNTPSLSYSMTCPATMGLTNMANVWSLNQSIPSLNNIISIDGNFYPCTVAGFTSALGALPSTGGTVDARGGCQGSIAWTSTLTLNKPVNLLLPKPGSATFTFTNGPGAPAIMIASSNVTVDGGNFVLSGPSLYGVRWTGPTAHTVVQNMTITGSGSLSDNQNGIVGYNAGGANSDIKILNNTISSTTVGILFNAFLVGESYSNLDIEGNTVFSIVGSTPGVGYGINVASGMGSGTGDVIGVRIAHNYLEDVGRHSIYTGFGKQFVVEGNIIKNHSMTVGGINADKAIECSRVQDIVISNNVLYGPWGGGIEVVTQPDFPPDSKFNKNTVVAHNVIVDPHVNAAFIIGTGTPSTDGFPGPVLLDGNTCYSTADPTINCLVLASGKNITVQNNLFQVVGATGLTNLIDILGSQETSGTANYTDNIEFHGNTLITDVGNAALVRVESAAATAGSTITFNQNSFEGSFAANGFFFPGSPLSDPNFTIATPTGAAAITSGFGTSPSFAFNKVQKEIQVVVGTGGTSTTGVLAMPTALNGWDCKATDLNTNIVTRETAYTTTSVTFTAASAWTAADKLLISCRDF